MFGTLKTQCQSLLLHPRVLCGIPSWSRTQISRLNVAVSPSQTAFPGETLHAFKLENFSTLGRQCIFVDFGSQKPGPGLSRGDLSKRLFIRDDCALYHFQIALFCTGLNLRELNKLKCFYFIMSFSAQCKPCCY